MRGIANTLADGISRWDQENVNRHLREHRSQINWQEHDLGLIGGDLCARTFRSGTCVRQLRDRLTYVSSFRSWIKSRGQTCTAWYSSDDTPVSDMVSVLVDFATWVERRKEITSVRLRVRSMECNTSIA